MFTGRCYFLGELVPIHLEAACAFPECHALAKRLHDQLGVPHYSTGCSLLAVPDSLSEWREAHRTARKRADRAGRLGYRFSHIDRAQHNRDIHHINTSKAVRQGRRMSDGYLQRYNHGSLPEQPCGRHRINTYGILEKDTLRAYLTLYRVGELAMVSMILGHGDHLENDIMWQLFAGVVEDQAGQGGWFFYNRWDSGLDGLRYYKSKMGFEPRDAEFILQ